MVRIAAILGRVLPVSENIELTEKDALPNSTRWVLDIEQPSESFSFKLITTRGLVVKPNVMSFSMGPLNTSFWSASPWLENGPFYTVKTRHFEGVAKYRLSIDIVHTLFR